MQMVVSQLLPPHVIKAITETEHDSQETGAPSNHGDGSSESPPAREGSGLGSSIALVTASPQDWRNPSVPSVPTGVTDASRNPLWGGFARSSGGVQFSESLGRVCLLFADVEGFTGIFFPPESVPSWVHPESCVLLVG